ncbi:MAG: cation:proton antiporter [Candidatus Omnitrophota bacterium]
MFGPEAILTKVSIMHLNILFLLGLALFGGAIGGRLFQKLRIPQVVGYIIIGILIGRTGLNIVDADTIEALKPFNYFALGLIGFMVGGELKSSIFKKYGKKFLYILVSEGVTPFILVTVFVGLVGSIFFGFSPFPWALAILLGSIASATDPATTTSVLKEYKTRGPLTTNIVGIVALDDGLALLLFTIASSVAEVLLGNSHGQSLLKNIMYPVYEIGGAVAIGVLFGAILSYILAKYSEKERVLAFAISTVLIVIGFSLASNVSMVLAVMTLGVFVVNFRPKKSKEVFGLVDGFTPPIYVLFFVLVGAKLEFSHITRPIMFLIIAYLFFVITGKMLGAYIGGRLSKSVPNVTRYLPFALFSQAGIAIGLSLLAAQHFPGDVGNTIIVIITTTTFFTQIIGPPFTKFAVVGAKEVGLNITEEDIIEKTSAQDVMDKNPPIVYQNMQLKDILKIFSDNDNLYYPVIDKDKKLLGIITVEGIKQTFLDSDMSDLILADDLMEPVVAKVSASTNISEVKNELNRYNIEYMPVINGGERLEGFIESKKLNKYISTKILELRKQADSLE